MTEIKPVAYLVQSYPPGEDDLEWAEWYEGLRDKPAAVPLYSAPAPELVAVLRKLVEQAVQQNEAHGLTASNSMMEAISEADALLARIEGEQK